MTIWKFPLETTDEQVVDMPSGAKALTVQTQDGCACLWALVNPDNATVEHRLIRIYGTGHSIPKHPGDYIGTYQLCNGALVFHVFEAPKVIEDRMSLSGYNQFTCGHCEKIFPGASIDGLCRQCYELAEPTHPNDIPRVHVYTGRPPWESGPGGFTLIELLVVIVIIVIISAVALPIVLPALSHRQVSEGARLLQAQLAGARDAAIRDNAPRGIRLLPDPVFSGINPTTGILDPNFPLAANRIVPIGSAPDYREGMISTWPGPGLPPSVAALPYSGPGTPANPNPTWGTLSGSPLMVFQSAVDPTTTLPNNPTSWFWNVRIGDQIQVNNAGPWYTVVGPMIVGPKGATIGGTFYANTELFVNVGKPGALSPLIDANGINVEFLLLVNGRDDDGNGWIDSGFDGVDNDGRNGVDDAGEWEIETWLGAMGGN